MKERNRKYRKKAYKKNPLKVYGQNIKRLYGITYDEYLELEKEQNHRCAICGLTLEQTKSNNGRKNKHFAIDHEYKTGKIRGLLCTNCNGGLGNFKDNPFIFLKAAEYIKKGKK